MKKIVILIVIILSGMLFFQSRNIISSYNSVFNETSSYELTHFDYTVSMTTEEQVVELESKTFIDNVLPTFIFSIPVNESERDIHVMYYDGDDSDKGLFNKSNLVESNGNNGAAIDLRLSQELNINLGDEISYILRSEVITKEVTDIYLSSEYLFLNEGVVYVEWGDTESGLFADKVLPYDMVFITVNDTTSFNSYIESYLPLGLLRTFDEFEEDYNENFNQPSYFTDEQWAEVIEDAYDAYELEFYNETYSGYVKSKTEDFATIEVRINNELEEIEKEVSRTISISIVILLVIFVVGSLLSSRAVAKADSSDQQGDELILTDLIVSFILFIGAYFGMRELINRTANDFFYFEPYKNLTSNLTLVFLVGAGLSVINYIVYLFLLRVTANKDAEEILKILQDLQKLQVKFTFNPRIAKESDYKNVELNNIDLSNIDEYKSHIMKLKIYEKSFKKMTKPQQYIIDRYITILDKKIEKRM